MVTRAGGSGTVTVMEQPIAEEVKIVPLSLRPRNNV